MVSAFLSLLSRSTPIVTNGHLGFKVLLRVMEEELFWSCWQLQENLIITGEEREKVKKSEELRALGV